MKLRGLVKDGRVVGHGCILGSGKWRVEKQQTALTGKILRASLNMLSEVDMNLEKNYMFSKCMCWKSSAYVLKFSEPTTTYRSLGDSSVTQTGDVRENSDGE